MCTHSEERSEYTSDTMQFTCEPCDRTFSSEEALQQHLQCSRIHTLSFCEECDRSFGSGEALQQHLRESSVHIPSFDCETCDRSFDSDGTLSKTSSQRGSQSSGRRRKPLELREKIYFPLLVRGPVHVQYLQFEIDSYTRLDVGA
jgi:hypothetical protein